MITLNLSDEESDALVEAVGLALRHFPHSPDYRFDALLSLLSLLLGKQKKRDAKHINRDLEKLE